MTSNRKTTKPKQTVGIFSNNSGKHTTIKESFPSKLKIVQVFKLPCQFLLKIKMAAVFAKRSIDGLHLTSRQNDGAQNKREKKSCEFDSIIMQDMSNNLFQVIW